MGNLIITDNIADRVKEMPMLSAVVSRLLQIMGDDDHSLQDIVYIVQNDAFLTSRVLRVANSAAYAPLEPIQTILKAIACLGEKMVMGIAIGSGSAKVFKRSLDGYESAAGELWDHSLRSAIASREIANYSALRQSSSLAFTAGLLHDIGKSIISEFLQGSTEQLTNLCDEGAAEDFLAAEREKVGTDHAAVGYELARHWRLPETLGAVIRYHHHPTEADDEFKELVYTAHLGDIVAMMGGTGTGADSLAYKIDRNYDKYIEMGKEELALVLLRVEEEFHRTKKSIIGSGEV